LTLLHQEAGREEHAFAAELATAAGRALLDLRATLDPAGSNGRELGSAGDSGSNRILLDALRSAYPDDLVLSEESPDGDERTGRRRVWIVDPLDGTREFGEPGRTDWAVHVALAIDGRVAAGAVALPGRGLTLSTAEPPAPPRSKGPLRIVVSRSRPPAMAAAVAERLGAELVEMGSAGAKAMAVVLGEADAYLHAGGQYEWDSAAPVAVALAAALHASRIDGTELVYNRRPAWLPDLLICRAEIADSLLGALRESASEASSQTKGSLPLVS
jgi:3'(2'), 5'-bisphosphate nucleotidase